VARPLVFPLSNPTSQSEAIPEDVLRWTEGRALVATGSPFAPVVHDGRTLRIGQANNVFVFPGVGLGAIVSEARQVTEEMFAAAAAALASAVSPEDLAEGSLFPSVRRLRAVTALVAQAVVEEAVRSGQASRPIPDPARAVAAAMWEPAYVPMTPGA
jgi:malate dehydrogenase (oxaloacetate-decarboxylating)